MSTDDKPKFAMKADGRQEVRGQMPFGPSAEVAPVSGERIRERLAREDLIGEMQFSRRQGQILRQSRRHRGLTQTEFATLMRVSRRLLSKMENGQVGIPCDLLYYAGRHLDGNFQSQVEQLFLELSFFITTHIRQRLTLH